MYDADSPIQIKILAQGQPTKINQQWFIGRFQQAFDIRKPLLIHNTNAYRLIYGENDHLPGLIIDMYDQVAAVKLYTSAWFPFLNQITIAIKEIIDPKAIVLRLSRLVQKTDPPISDGSVIDGQLEQEEIIFSEYGIKFSANVIKGHKTGYFLDHRDNRNKVGLMAKGKTVLDIFSYAGGFSVHALANGAKKVVSVDISAQALELAKKNAALNVQNPNHHIIAKDAFEAMQELIEEKQKFDIVVVDPPSFAKQQSDIDKALQSYSRLAKLAIQLVRDGGYCVMASCSSRITADQFYETVENAFSKSPHRFRLEEKTFHDIDHPIGFPEGAYLKTGYYKVEY